MSTDSFPLPERLSDPVLAARRLAPGEEGLPVLGFTNDLRGTLLVLAGLGLVGLIALFDYGTGPDLSFGIFYLIPVALCAWWCGFAHGIILALGGAVAWHLVDSIENPLIPPIAGIWNGVVRFGTLVLTSSLVARLHRAVLREHLLARTDPLTGAANGRTFYEAAAVESERARRTASPLTLAYFDLDNFKQLNDRFGHATGDAALMQVVRTLQLSLRSSDLVARLGGDEFALLMPETGAEGAVTLLKRLQTAVAQEMAQRGWPVSLSIGAVTFDRPALDVDLMIQRVDALMYRAKTTGKGRTEHETLAGPKSKEESGRRTERRATARVLDQRQARVRQEGQAENQAQFATIRNLVADKISVTLESGFSLDTLLIIEPLSPGKTPLLARVTRVTPEDRNWKHECELATRLGGEDLSNWLAAC